MADYTDEMKRLGDELDEAIEHDRKDESIEVLSVQLIAHMVQACEPRARYMVLDWSDQGGNHHVVSGFLGEDGVTRYDDGCEISDCEDHGGFTVSTLATNLRGEVVKLYSEYSRLHGTGTVDLRAVLA